MLAVTAAVTALAFLMAPSAGRLPFEDDVLNLNQDNRAIDAPLREERLEDSRVPEPTPTAAQQTPAPRATGSRTGSPRGRGSEGPVQRRTPRAPERPTVALDGRRVGGWMAGASGIGVPDGSFESWLGQRVTVAAMWADTSDEVQRTLPSLTSEYRNWRGAVDIAVGGTVLGSSENYAAAASGAYDDRWRAAAKVLAESRRNATGPTFARPFHEMNGDWYDNWMVTRENSADFKKAFARYAGILREEMPQVYIAWSPNWSDHTNLPVEYWYPGDSVVDVVAPDYYNDYAGAAMNSVAAWNEWSTEKDKNGSPFGLEAWRQFALAHGKPLAFPEWGIKPSGQGGGDSPEWIRAVNSWMNKHANSVTWRLGEDIPRSASGKVLYSCYFNVVHEGQSGFTIYGAGANPGSAGVFNKLRWGTFG